VIAPSRTHQRGVAQVETALCCLEELLMPPSQSLRRIANSPNDPLPFSPSLRLVIRVIDSAEKLGEFLPRLKAADWIALDTEADSLHAYPEKLCLVQISVGGADELIDPLAGLDLVPLLETLRPRELILHGADYDLRLLHRGLRFAPERIFDTMLAARILGYREFGLTHLVAANLGITLEKGPQKMNWARRPLTERMECYARNDTHYLQPLAKILREQLIAKGRLEWLEQTCQALIRECAQPRVQDPESVWRIKGSDRLDRAGLAMLRELWHWREAEAVEANKPPYFIMSHEMLVSLAGRAAHGQLNESELIPGFSARRRNRFIAAVQRGKAVPTAEQPKHLRSTGHRLNRNELERFEELRKQRDRQAEALGIDATLIASRSTLVLLAANWDKHRHELMPWQAQLLAPERA
jgi:ribonuclease D